ncbi:MAG: bifunctional 4-hydroxy-2-oxoglutarate aldolase/2-dehydro-3-deoxy-phosphogluconate aldolase [Desulfobulbales bacterium]
MSIRPKNTEMTSGDQHLLRLKTSVIGILRGTSADEFRNIMHISFAAGLQAIEVTMNTQDAERIVAANRAHVPAGNYLGMGTIRNVEEAQRAYDAGAMFFVTPNFDSGVLEFARSKTIPVITGALTPSEIYKAWVAGATMVKVFPSRALGGPAYIRELRGPFESIPLVAVGGVTIENVSEYLKAGANAVGVGISLFGEQAVKNGDWNTVGRNVQEFVQRCSLE